MSISQWVKKNSIILFNTGSLVGTMLVTSVLGFAYWLVADRIFPTEEVGLASAATSAMMLLSTLFLMGQGTLLITELPRNKGREGSLISASLLIVGGSSLLAGIIFAALTPLISPQLTLLGSSPLNILLFAFGVCMGAVTVILDQAVIGLLFGGLQLWRNTLFAVSKLALLIGLGMLFSKTSGISISIYTMWSIGNVISLLPIIFFLIKRKKLSLKHYIPQWQMMRKLGRSTIQHHVLNLILQAPTQTLPIIVTILLSARMNAWFYTASMMANFIFSLSQSLTTVLHAANAGQSSSLTQKTRLTIGLSFLSSLVLGMILMFGANFILKFFGADYAQNAAQCLRILVLAAIPLTIKNHYIAINRIKDHVSKAILPVSVGALLELGAAVVGARLGGLNGLSLGWVIAMVVEALFMAPVVLKTLIGPSALDRYLDQIAATETVMLPAFDQLDQFHPSGAIQLSMLGNTITLTELDTVRLPVPRKQTPPAQQDIASHGEETLILKKGQVQQRVQANTPRGEETLVLKKDQVQQRPQSIKYTTAAANRDFFSTGTLDAIGNTKSTVQPSTPTVTNRAKPAEDAQHIRQFSPRTSQQAEEFKRQAEKMEVEPTPASTSDEEQLEFPEMPTLTRLALDQLKMPYQRQPARSKKQE